VAKPFLPGLVACVLFLVFFLAFSYLATSTDVSLPVYDRSCCGKILNAFSGICDGFDGWGEK
jgi:hypothetical protein